MKKLLLIFVLASATAAAAPPCCSTNLPPDAPLSDASIYQLESTWTSDYGKALQLPQLRGKVQVLTMFFASCNYACPILVHDLQKIEAALHAAGITNVGFVLVTFDIENDTVEKLHSYRNLRGLDDNWLLLRAASSDVAELAAVLGVKYKQEPSGQFAHSNIITVLNEQGEIIHQQIGLNTDPAPTLAAIQNQLASRR